MAGINLRKYLGIAPKVSPELLPDTSAQVARNTKLYSGDLIPHPQSVIYGDSGRPTGTLTLYGLRDPDTGELVWLTWDTYVDVAKVTTEKGGEFRFFYTGDGPPKMSTFDLATSGPPPYPTEDGWYLLGMPLPTTKLGTSHAPFVRVHVYRFARDVDGMVTAEFSTPHKVKDRGLITITGHVGQDGVYTMSGTTATLDIIHNILGSPSVPVQFMTGDGISGTYPATIVDDDTFTVVLPAPAATGGTARLVWSSFNASSVPATVTSPTVLKYSAPGYSAKYALAYPDVFLDLGGPESPRTYVYTWYSEFGEESIASDPSDIIYVKDGEIVTVTNIPTSAPAGDYRINGVRLYRSVGDASGSDYMLLKTLWFPKTPIAFSRAAGVATVEFSAAHAMIVDDRFRIAGMADATFNVADAVVTGAPTTKSLTYAAPGPDVARTLTSVGTVWYDVAEDPSTDPPRYWGNTTYDFIDDFDTSNLTEVLVSDNYEAPPENLEGLITAQNGILAGFVDNVVYFSLPYKPQAWPSEYAVILDYEVVALALMSGTIVVLTTGYPFLISGNDPAVLSTRRLDSLYPCINRKGVVSMNYGVVYPTHEGLAVISTQLSGQVATKALFNIDTWHTHLTPEEIVAEFYGDAYVASWSGGSFNFEPLIGEQAPPYFIDYDPVFSAAYYDPVLGSLFYAKIDTSSVFEWDPLGGAPLVQTWKSKVFKTPDMINIGAARVIADYPPVSLTYLTWNEIDVDWQDLDATWYAMSPSVEFSLFANKEVVATVQVASGGIFRLPSGYRTDTFEVAVTSDVRIRSIHLAETPYALRQV